MSGKLMSNKNLHTPTHRLHQMCRLVVLRGGSSKRESHNEFAALLDYNHTTLAGGIHITATDTDLGKVCAAEIDDFRSAHAEMAPCTQSNC